MRRPGLQFAALLAGLPLAGCYPQADFVTSAEPPPKVEVLETKLRPSHSGPQLVGRLEAGREAVLYFEVSGIVEQVHVREGDSVKAGQPIAHLIRGDYEQDVLRARADLAAARARLRLLEEGTRPEDIAAAEAAHRRAQAVQAYFSAEYQRTAETFRKGSATESELDAAKRNLKEAVEALATAKSRLDLAIAGPRLQEINAAKAEVVAAQAALELSRRQLAKATLTAPFAGRIERRFVDEGAYINVFPTGGVPVVHLLDLRQVEAVIDLPERLSERYSAGDEIEIRSSVDPTLRAVGRVKSVGRLSDLQSGTYELRITVPNSAGRLRVGMVVVTTVPPDDPKPLIHVPLSCIRRDYDGRTTVLVYNDTDQRVESRAVQLGELDGDEVQVLAGLRAAEKVVTAGHHRLVAGDVVRIEQPIVEDRE